MRELNIPIEGRSFKTQLQEQFEKIAASGQFTDKNLKVLHAFMSAAGEGSNVVIADVAKKLSIAKNTAEARKSNLKQKLTKYYEERGKNDLIKVVNVYAGYSYYLNDNLNADAPDQTSIKSHLSPLEKILLGNLAMFFEGQYDAVQTVIEKHGAELSRVVQKNAAQSHQTVTALLLNKIGELANTAPKPSEPEINLPN